MTIPRALKQANANYQCAHFGKWGERMISTPEQCGYDLSDGMTGNVTGGMAAKEREYHLVDDPKRTGTVSSRAIQFMAKQSKANKPFYVQVSYYAVHLRVELLKESLKKYNKKGTPDRGYTPAWAGMLEELDRGIGSILSAVDALGIGENTYVVFMADSGGRGNDPHRKRVSQTNQLSLVWGKTFVIGRWYSRSFHCSRARRSGGIAVSSSGVRL